MSLDVVKESVRVNQFIREETAQAVVESDIIVPDIKPDIVRIIFIEGEAIVINTTIEQDKVVVSGLAKYRMLYEIDDESKGINSINASSNFTHVLDISNTRQGMKCDVKCDIEHIDCEILNGRKLSIKSIVSINGKVFDEICKDIISEVKDVEGGIQILKDKVDVQYYLGFNETICNIKEELDIPSVKPSIRDIIRGDVTLLEKDCGPLDDKVNVKGVVNISTIYKSDDENESVQYIEHQIPFIHTINVPEADERTVSEIDYQVYDVKLDVVEDEDGELRKINAEIELKIKAISHTKKTIEMISDGYGNSLKLNFEKEHLKIKEMVCEINNQAVVKNSLYTSKEDPEIVEVLNVISKPMLQGYGISDNRLVIDGIITSTVLYTPVNSGNQIACFLQETPFQHNIELKNKSLFSDCDISLDVERSSFSLISSTEVETRIAVNIIAKMKNEVLLPITTKIVETVLDEKVQESIPNLTIYFSQPGDTLWKIAKRYRTTIDEIKKINGIVDDENIAVGQQVFIPR